MSHLFTPKRADGIAEHRLVADFVLEHAIGDTITYKHIAALLGHEEVDRRRLQTIARRANRELRRNHQRSLEAVVNTGYRILHPSEHVMQARRYQDRSRRSMKTGVQVLRATDLNQLSVAEQQQTVAAMMVMGRLVQAMESLDRRQRRSEELIEGLRSQVAGHDEALRLAGLLPADVDKQLAEGHG